MRGDEGDAEESVARYLGGGGPGDLGGDPARGGEALGKEVRGRARARPALPAPGRREDPPGVHAARGDVQRRGEGRRSAVDASDTGSCIAANASAREPRVAHSEGLKIAAIRLDTPRTRATARYARAKSAETAEDQTCAPTRRQACISATSRVYHA